MIRQAWLSGCVGLLGLFALAGNAQEIVGTPWTGPTGVGATTHQLMRQQQITDASTAGVERPPRIKPVLRPDRSNLPQNPDALPTPQPPKALTLPAERATPKVQTLSTNFVGATLNDTHAFPPDSMGAIGPTQYIVAVNGRIRSFDKTTGLADGVLNVDTDVFFNSVMTPPTSSNFSSDPRIRYDRLSGRWFIIIIDVPGGIGDLPNRVMLAVSDDSTITGGTVWTYFYFQNDLVGTTPNADTDQFADYPTLGIDANAMYIGVNMFSTSTGAYLHTTAFVVRKSSALGAGPIVVTAFRNLTSGSTGAGPYTPQGVDNYDPAATEGYFIGVDNMLFSKLQVRRVSTPGGTPTLSANIPINVATTFFPNTVPHLGNTGGNNGRLDALDDRLFAAHIRNGRLWTAHNIMVNASGVATSNTGVGRDASRWYELQDLNTATPTPVQTGTVFDSASLSTARWHWIPSILVSGQGHAVLGYSTAGNAEHANAAFTGRYVGDAVNTMQGDVLITNTSAAYNPPGDSGGSFGRRWGDYSYTSLDPEDDMTMWTIQEYTDSTNIYGVRVAKLLAPPPATPASSSPPSVVTGQSSVIVTITGTQVAGSGFFDPGTCCTKHIMAAVSGGVTVNSVTYNSPTSVTLDLSTVGTSAGAKDVTIINPDGQSLTGTGILTVTGGAGAPAITSASSTTFTVGTAGSFTVMATGTPTPTLSESGALPAGVTFTPATGVLAGTPGPGTGGVYHVTFTASNGVPPDATQNFTLTVNQAPAITSVNSTTFAVGMPGSFTVTATGFPAPTLSESGALPTGVGFNSATGVLSGTPSGGTSGTYNLSFTASNGVAPNAMQNFTLKVLQTLGFAGQYTYLSIQPCRIVDTRFAGGPIAGGSSRQFLYYNTSAGFSWSSQGGTAGLANAACPGTTLTSAGGTLGNAAPAAAVATITTVNSTSPGNFVVWGGAAPAPTTSALNWRSAGQVIANTTTIPWGGRTGSTLDFAVKFNSLSGSTDVVVDVVGYFVPNAVTALQCVTLSAAGSGTHNPGTRYTLNFPTCGAGYKATGYGCVHNGALPLNVYLEEVSPTLGFCDWFNNSGGDFSAANYDAETVCCRVPGQ